MKILVLPEATAKKTMVTSRVQQQDCKVNLIEEEEEEEVVVDCGGRVSLAAGEGGAGRQAVLGRFDSVLERRSCARSLRDLALTLPWCLLLLSLAQVAVEYLFGREASLALSLRSGHDGGGGTGAEVEAVGEVEAMEHSLRSYLR